MKSSKNVRSVQRAFDILFCIARGVDTITEVSKDLGLNKSTVHRLLVTLENSELVFRDSKNVFEIGPKLANVVANSIFNDNGIIKKAHPSMIKLNALTNETVTLHIPKGFERICIAEEESPHPVRFTAGIGRAVSLRIGAASTVLLAYMDPNAQRVILESFFPAPAVKQDALTKKEICARRIKRAVKDGYALSFGERIINAACLSVPVFNSIGIIAAISVLGPNDRLPEKLILNYLPELQSEAAKISEMLGCFNYSKAVFKKD